MGEMRLFYSQTVLKAAISATFHMSLETQIWLKQFLHTFFADQWIKLFSLLIILLPFVTWIIQKLSS